MGNYILIDSHVHLHPFWAPKQFLDCAYNNFKKYRRAEDSSLPGRGILCLTESATVNQFAHIKKNLAGCSGKTLRLGQWQLSLTGEANSIMCTSPENGKIILIAGRQIVCQEGLEILALGTPKEFKDGLPAAQTIELILQEKAIPVMAWGVGKWLGKKGKLVEKIINGTYEGKIFLGDIGGRPGFWTWVPVFEEARSKKLKILRGSDPLPLASEIHRVGSFGFMLEGEISDNNPYRDLMVLLHNPSLPIKPYGNQERFLRFITVQVLIRLKKYINNLKKGFKKWQE